MLLAQAVQTSCEILHVCIACAGKLISNVYAGQGHNSCHQHRLAATYRFVIMSLPASCMIRFDFGI